jgi:outer membrane protein insertion porin family
MMPIINAPFRLYFAYNPLRLYERPYCNEVSLAQKVYNCNTQLITQDMFPNTDAGVYTYKEVIAAYGSQYVFREPRKTFRLTVSTTF